VCYPLEHI
jgi:phosphoenolpyruvate carboxykinase (ATP)